MEGVQNIKLLELIVSHHSSLEKGEVVNAKLPAVGLFSFCSSPVWMFANHCYEGVIINLCYGLPGWNSIENKPLMLNTNSSILLLTISIDLNYVL